MLASNPTARPRVARWRGSRKLTTKRRGQVLLIAVLLMGVILLVGILFAAIVSFNQEQSARHLDLVAAQLQADAGINYASAMLENSPQGADWRPRFVPYAGTGTEVITDSTTWPKDPATWPNPPAKYEDGSVDFNFFGPDGIEGTDDDYYSDFEIVRGWFPLRHGSPSAPGDFIRMGYFRFPDPNQVASSSGGKDAQNIGRGYFLLQVTYDPDPPYEPGDPTTQDRMSGYTKITSIGRSVQESNVFRRVVAYKPIGLMDNMRWITNKSGQASQAVLGVRANVDMDASGSWDPSGRESLYSYLSGPIRSEVPLYWAGQQVVASPSTVFRLRDTPDAGEGYLRDDFVLAGRGLYALDDPDAASGAAVQVDGGANQILPLALDPDMTTTVNRVHIGSRDVPAMAAPDLDATDPTSDVPRYAGVTRDSGRMTRVTTADPTNGLATGDPVNTGYYGAGAGMYINNVNDVQFRGADGRSDLNQLQSDWLKTGTGTGPGGGETGWNALFTTYTPPGVEIEFFPTEQAVLDSSSAVSWLSTPPTSPGVLWWPRHQQGEPGIKITRHDQRWRIADNESGTWVVGADSGRNVMIIDYPKYPNQVILAEGNARVKGILPLRNQVTRARTYDVTIVSNATIYIDGELMTAQDVHGRAYGTNDPAYAPADSLGAPSDPPTGPVLDENTAKVALLAKDNVVLNPTQLVPQLTSGLVTAAADDPTNPTLADQHWELFPDAAGACYSQWRFGWPDIDTDADGYGNGSPGTPVGAGVTVAVTPIHSGADPGPSGMGMTVWNEPDAATRAHLFTTVVGAFDPDTFLFLPPGSLLPGTTVSVGENISNAIMPNWQTPGRTPSVPFNNPLVPFPLSDTGPTREITKAIGDMNAISLFHRDPQVGAGSTPYLLKKWKIEELTVDPTSGYQLPQGAIHAKINALMYAQRGSWFVIPGAYFDPKATTTDLNNDGVISPLESLYAARFRRYNYEITVRGAITEDHAAPIGAVQTWTTRWGYPIYTGSGNTLALSWGTIRYQFDERLRMDRDQAPTTLTGNTRSSSTLLTTPESMLPKLPCLPSSRTLIYTGGAS